MKYEQRVVAFIDFLGFKNIIGETENSEHALKNLLNALEFTRHHFRPIDPDGVLGIKERNVTHFSDSIVISFSISEESGVFHALNDIRHLLMVLAQNGYLCRGGISAGKMIHTGDVAFGPAFIEAYELESKKADAPRVIVPEHVLELGATFHADHHDFEMEQEYIKRLVTKDEDGFYYIDYFEKCISEMDEPESDSIVYFGALKKMIDEGLQSNDGKIRSKFEWMARKHNQMAKHIHEVKSAFDL